MKKHVFKAAVKTNQKTCSICLKNFKKEDDIIRTKCEHYFHWECISKWFKSSDSANHKSCPFRCPGRLEISMPEEVKEFNEELKKSVFGGIDLENLHKLV